MAQTSHLNGALGRLRNVFCRAAGAPLTDTELAASAQLDHDECVILLAVLQETGAIDRLRSHVFICRPSSWWTYATVRPQSARPSSDPYEDRSISDRRFVSTPAGPMVDSGSTGS